MSLVYITPSRHIRLSGETSIPIRSATLADEPALLALWSACNLVVPYNDPAADLHFALAQPNSTVLVHVDSANIPVGSVLVGHDGHRGWLYYVATAPDSRGQGIARDLIHTAELWLQHRGIHKVQLLIREANPAVVAFYEHLGFELTPRVVMAKWLR